MQTFTGRKQSASSTGAVSNRPLAAKKRAFSRTCASEREGYLAVTKDPSHLIPRTLKQTQDVLRGAQRIVNPSQRLKLSHHWRRTHLRIPTLRISIVLCKTYGTVLMQLLRCRWLKILHPSLRKVQLKLPAHRLSNDTTLCRKVAMGPPLRLQFRAGHDDRSDTQTTAADTKHRMRRKSFLTKPLLLLIELRDG